MHVFSAKDRNQKLLLSFRHICCPHPRQPQLAANLVSKIYTIFGSGTRLTPDFVFKPRVNLMHAAGGKRHCFTAQILNEAVQSEKKG